MNLSDLIALSAFMRPPPAMRPLPKAASNVTPLSMSRAALNAPADPIDMFKMMVTAASVPSEIALREAQAREARRRSDVLGQFDLGGIIGASVAPSAAPMPLSPSPAPASVSFDGGGSSFLASLLPQAAAAALPPGYTARITSQDRPGARVAGTGGVSQHARENAVDVQIVDPNGQAIPNKGEDTTGLYGRLALGMRNLMPADRRGELAWGGNFTTGPQNGPRDLMHFDLAGDRGRFETFAQLAQSASAAPPQSGARFGLSGSSHISGIRHRWDQMTAAQVLGFKAA